MTVTRVGARVLLVDEQARVLLIQERIEGPPGLHWLTPGGGVEPGENLAVAAAREVYEETGIRVELPPDAPVVHRQRRVWTWQGVTYEQLDHFFLAAVAGAIAVSPARLTPMEQETLIGHRWWSADEVRESADTFEPPDLAHILGAFCPFPDTRA